MRNKDRRTNKCLQNNTQMEQLILTSILMQNNNRWATNNLVISL